MRSVLAAVLALGCLVGCGAPEDESEEKSELLEGTTEFQFFGHKYNVETEATPEFTCNQFMFSFVTNEDAHCKAVTLETDYVSEDETTWTFTSPDDSVNIVAAELGDGKLKIGDVTYYCWLFSVVKTVPSKPEDSLDYDHVTFTAITPQNDVSAIGDVESDKLAFVGFTDGADCKLAE